MFLIESQPQIDGMRLDGSRNIPRKILQNNVWKNISSTQQTKLYLGDNLKHSNEVERIFTT